MRDHGKRSALSLAERKPASLLPMPTAFRILAGFWVLFSTWVVAAHLSVLVGGTVAALAALGIGAAVAKCLAAEGANVTIVGIDFPPSIS